jgi:hypothetical protein
MSNVKIARKKPIEIEVIQITGDDKKIEEINDFCGQYTFKRISPLLTSQLLMSPLKVVFL